MGRVDVGAEDVAADTTECEHVTHSAEVQALAVVLLVTLTQLGFGQALVDCPARATAVHHQRTTSGDPALERGHAGVAHGAVSATGQHDGGVARQIHRGQLCRIQLGRWQTQ
ncbi:hypothetical protein D9M73_286120 [compost metagenome]